MVGGFAYVAVRWCTGADGIRCTICWVPSTATDLAGTGGVLDVDWPPNGMSFDSGVNIAGYTVVVWLSWTLYSDVSGSGVVAWSVSGVDVFGSGVIL